MKPVIYFPMYSLWILLYNGFKPKTSPRILTKYILGQCKTLQNEKKIGNEIDGLYKFERYNFQAKSAYLVQNNTFREYSLCCEGVKILPPLQVT